MRKSTLLKLLAILPFLSYATSYSVDYKRGIIDTIKMIENQEAIDFPDTNYIAYIDVSEEGRPQILFQMVIAQRELFTPILVWLNGKKYIVLTGDDDPEHLRSLCRNSSFADMCQISPSSAFKGARKMLMVKYCRYPIYDINTLLYALKKRIKTDIPNRRKRERILRLISEIEKELKPTSEDEIFELLNIGDN